MRPNRNMAGTLLSIVIAAAVAAGCGTAPAQPQTGAQPQQEAKQETTAQPKQETKAPAQEESKAASTAAGDRYQVVPAESTASYSVGETFLGQQRDATAVGTTSAFTGEIVLNGGKVQPSVVQVDLSTLKSDESRRDNRVRAALDTNNHKFAVFRIAEAEGDPLAEGKETALKLKGTMTIKGTEKPLTFDATAKLSGGTLTLTAATTFNMTDFGVNPPNIAGFVRVNDEVKLNITFVGKKQ